MMRNKTERKLGLEETASLPYALSSIKFIFLIGIVNLTSLVTR